MITPFTQVHWHDSAGNPTGGTSWGPGFCISWQNGPLGRGADRRPPNGAFVETIIAAARDRLDFYQESKFACDENKEAIEALNKALKVLNERTQAREARQVEGSHLI